MSDDIVERAWRTWVNPFVTDADPRALLLEMANEITRLREAIRRLAEQDATLSVCEGNVTVTMDATLTDAEREAVEKAAWYVEAMAGGDLAGTIPPTLRGLLERTKGGER